MRTLTLSLIVVGLVVSNASAREWTNAMGQKVDAEYLGIENGMVKMKFNATGKIAAVVPAALSEEDQKWVQDQVRLEAERKEDAAGPPDRFTLAIRKDSNNATNYINRGRSRTSKGDFDGAIMDFTKAINMNAEQGVHDPDAYNGRGKAYHRKNQLIDAQRDFNQAIQVDPKFGPAYRNRGENLRKLALDKTQSVPELDQAIERWQMFMNKAHQSNMKRAPWQPLNATKGDVSRQAVLQQMAKIDIQWADWLGRGHDGDWGHGGHGGHGHGCHCAACSGCGCPYCDGSGCPACGGGKPAPGLGVYPPECMKGEMITLVANASQLMKGMPAEAKPGQKPGPNAPKILLDSVDFYRDVNGDGLFKAADDQFLASDSEHSDGFTTEVSTAAFPPGPQSFFAVPRGGEGTGSGSSPAELLSAAEACEKAAQTEQGIAQACEAGKAQGMPADQSKGLGGDQSDISDDAAEVAEKIAGACPEAAELLEEAAKPMKAVRNLMKTAATKPGEACKEQAEKANEKAKDASEKLAEAAEKLREAYEAAQAAGAGNPGQAPASAATGAPTSGAGELLAAAPIGARGPGGGGEGGDEGDNLDDEDEEWVETIVEEEIYDDEDVEEIVEIAEEYIEEDDYDGALVAYDELLQRDPDNLVYLRDRANTHMLRGGYDYAVRDYDYLLKQREEPDADLYYNRGCAHLAAGRLDHAIADFNKSIELNETYSLAYNNRGATFARKGDFDQAIVDFDKAIEIEPANRLAFRNRALAYKKLGNLKRAQEDFAVVMRLEKDAPATPEN